jgi:hypothetical protein
MTWFVLVSGGPSQRAFHVGRQRVSAEKLQRALSQAHPTLLRVPRPKHGTSLTCLVVPDEAIADVHPQEHESVTAWSVFCKRYLVGSPTALFASTRISGREDGADEEKKQAEPVAAAAAAGGKRRREEESESGAALLRDVGRARHQQRAEQMHRQQAERARAARQIEQEAEKEAERQAAEEADAARLEMERDATRKRRETEALDDLLRCVADLNLCQARIGRATTWPSIQSGLEHALASLCKHYSPARQAVLPSPAANNIVRDALNHLHTAVSNLVHALDTNHAYSVRFGSNEMNRLATLVEQISAASHVAIELAPVVMDTSRDALLAQQLSRQQHFSSVPRLPQYGAAGNAAAAAAAASAPSSAVQDAANLAQIDRLVLDVDEEMATGAPFRLARLQGITKKLNDARRSMPRLPCVAPSRVPSRTSTTLSEFKPTQTTLIPPLANGSAASRMASTASVITCAALKSSRSSKKKRPLPAHLHFFFPPPSGLFLSSLAMANAEADRVLVKMEQRHDKANKVSG